MLSAGLAPKKQKPARVKRTKTFTGCWTCRSRGVKCDERKPTCFRCSKGHFSCSGYAQRLIWEDDRDRNQKGLQRRVLLGESGRREPVLTDEETDAALAAVDAIRSGECFHSGSGPFGVFSISRSGRDSIGSVPRHVACTHKESQSPTSGCATRVLTAAITPAFYESVTLEVKESNKKWKDKESEDVFPWASEAAVVPTKSDFLSLYTPPLSSPLRDGRQLMHHWVTVFSVLMIPTEHSDNPFRSIYIPLALLATEQKQSRSGHLALLHAMYAISAFHQSQLCPTDVGHSAIGAKHHCISLRYLHRSLLEQQDSQQEAILAAIISLHLIDMINGHSSSWRVHLRGARDWLQSLDGTTWHSSESASTLYQLFLCIEVLGPSNGGMATMSHSLEASRSPKLLAPNYTLDSIFGITTTNRSYCLDKLYGVTRPIFEVIVHINLLLKSGTQPPQSELDEIEFKIILNNPTSLHLPFPSFKSEELTKHHASSFYYACYIYFKHTLRRDRTNMMQGLVRKSLEHLEAIEGLEMNVSGYGLMWPIFITACEARDQDLRDRVIQYLHQGTKLGMETFTSAAKVVQEVWRRLETEVYNHLDWREVMKDLGIDLILI